MTLTAQANAGNVFVQWHGDASGTTNPLTLVMDGNKSITAEFARAATAVPGGPLAFELSAIAPNPSPGNARVDFALAVEGRVRLTVYDVAGREVARLVDEIRAPGRYSVRWTGGGGRGTASAGIYFVRLQSGGRSAVRRLVLMP